MNTDKPWGSIVTEEHKMAAKKIAEESIVLLKNDKNLLPIDTKKYKNILVVGDNATKPLVKGGGSASLKTDLEILPLDGIKKRFGKEANITYAVGYLSNHNLGAQTRGWQPHEAIEAAEKADLVIFIGGLNKTHGLDREQADRASIDLPYGQDKLIKSILDVNKNTIVVILSGSQVAMPWVKQAPAILEAWYGGSMAGSAIAAVLSGDVNPSGKLPMSFPVDITDNSAHSPKGGEYPGNGIDIHYKDDIFVGYRWLEKEKIKPLFAFGHGLSYSNFKYDKIKLSNKEISDDKPITVQLNIKNTSNVDGAEVVQLYISEEKPSVARPMKELKGFQKVFVKAGEEKTVEIEVAVKDLQFYDDTQNKWTANPGKFKVLVGSSSADIRQSETIIYN